MRARVSSSSRDLTMRPSLSFFQPLVRPSAPRRGMGAPPAAPTPTVNTVMARFCSSRTASGQAPSWSSPSVTRIITLRLERELRNRRSPRVKALPRSVPCSSGGLGCEARASSLKAS